MELFGNSISEIQKYTNVDSTLSMKSLEPFEFETINMYLLDWLGTTQFNKLVNFPDTAEHIKLLPYVQRAIANFMVYEYIDKGSVSIGNSGINRTESDNQKTAYKYQVSVAKQGYLESGWNAIESMIEFLFANRTDYPDWDSSGAKLKSRAFLINTYKEFKGEYHVVSGRWTYEGLRAIMEDVELFSIVPAIGQTFYDMLKAEILNDTISNYNKAALKFLRKAVAYLTIEQAIAQKVGTIQNNSFVFSEQTGDDFTMQTREVSSASKQRNAKTNGIKYLNYAKEFLISNKTNYPEFATWYDAKLAATLPTSVVETKNKKILFI